MFTMEELTAALDNPNSPARAKLLNNLSMSPLDPAAAYQQLLQGSPETMAMPPQQTPPQPSMADVVGGGTGPQIQGASMNPMPFEGGAGKGPWSLNYAGMDNDAGATDPNNPNFIPPAAAQATGTDPMARLMPGETGGMPGAVDMPDAGNDEAIMKMLQGAGGVGGQRQQQQPTPGAVAPKGNNWNTFQAAQFQTPGVGQRLSLADLLDGRG